MSISWKSALCGTVCVIGMALFGFAAGGLLGGRVFTPERAMGWDALANALGGAALGIAGGAVLGGVLVRRLSNPARLRTGAGAVAAGAVLIAVIRWFNT